MWRDPQERCYASPNPLRKLRQELGGSPPTWQDAIVAPMPDRPKQALRVAFLAADNDEARRALTQLEERYAHVPSDQADVIVALGGDGMMLETLHRFIGRDVPIFG